MRVLCFLFLMILLLGCDELTDLNSHESTTEAKKFVSGRGYQLELIDITTISNVGVKKEDVTKVTLRFTATGSAPIKHKPNNIGVVLNDGTQKKHKQIVNDNCYNSWTDDISLFPGAKTDLFLCFPRLFKEKEPKLFLGILEDYEIIQGADMLDYRFEGNQKYYQFDISSNLEDEIQ